MKSKFCHILLHIHIFSRNLMKLNTYNAKRQQKYGNRYFIGCEEMIVKRLRNECKISTDDFTDDELMSLIGLFEMYGSPLPNKAKAFHTATCYMRSECAPNSYTMLQSNYSMLCKV